ncbi:MAG: TonB-dependent receptor [Caulobacteraceae bacterium]|nr:TonB-dependent receptor [Caulobacteraceae bacterium]
MKAEAALLRSKLLRRTSAALGLAALPAAALADEPAAEPDTVQEVVVTARKLDAARASVEPDLGASTYALPRQLVERLPGGENVGLNQVLLQAPGAVQDSFGQLHIRGDHGNLQYRLNNVILPEGLSVFGQALSPRLADSTELITGALPAQYGLRTAGVVNITTKSGVRPGGEVSLYGGAHGEIEPSLAYGGTSGATNVFVSGSYLRNDLGVEAPENTTRPLHDRTDQLQGFAYLDHILDAQNRVSMILGTSDQRFQIPNRRGLNADDPGGLGLTVLGQSAFASEALNESQRENTQFGIVSFQHSTDASTIQISGFTRYSTLTFSPDPLGDLLFNGIAQAARKSDLAGGLQAEGVFEVAARHTLRTGVILQADRAASHTSALALPTDAAGAQLSEVPLTIADNSAKTQTQASFYLQDEWKLLESLTVNYGVRLDAVDAYRREKALSPRVNLVWTPLAGTTVHAGYARYFTPPPFELVAGETISKFLGTTAAPQVTQDDLPRAETDNYYDVGAQQKLGALTLGIDGYWRDAKNLIDEGQFGAPIILTPFNYQTGKIRGVELSMTYAKGPLSAWANLAYGRAKGRDIISSQFNFAPEDLAFIAGHYVFLDHNQTYTASAGASYRWGDFTLSGDLLFGSGLRRDLLLTDGSSVPNGGHLPAYTQVNLAASYRLAAAGGIELRLDVVNLFDARYEIRDGTGVGVGAPQWGPTRGVFGGVSKAF